MHQRSEFDRGYIATIEITILPLTAENDTVEHIAALSRLVPQSSSGADQIMADPVVADWAGSVDWIDLGAGIPESHAENSSVQASGRKAVFQKS